MSAVPRGTHARAITAPPWPLAIQRAPTLPEIDLALLSPELDLAAPGAAHAGAPPYWGFAWASGLALARHLLDHPHEVRGRRVLDFGCGSGVAGIAAALAGARAVQACDIDPAARRAARANGRRNGATIEVRASLDRADPFDVLLAADVIYEDALLPRLRAVAARGARVLLADPGRGDRRPSVPFRRLRFHRVRTLPELDETTPGAVVYAAGGHTGVQRAGAGR